MVVKHKHSPKGTPAWNQARAYRADLLRSDEGFSVFSRFVACCLVVAVSLRMKAQTLCWEPRDNSQQAAWPNYLQYAASV